MLEHHLEIFQVARTKVLQPDELVAHRDSLVQIMYVFMARIERLKGEHVLTFNLHRSCCIQIEIFRQVYRNSLAQFEHFAYGMVRRVFS